MEEIRFQYENDLRLTEQAAASVKKTEWLEYLQHLRRSVWVTAPTGTVFTAISILEWLVDRKSDSNIGAIASILTMLLIAVAFFRTWSKLDRKYSLIKNRTYGAKPFSAWSFILIFAICFVLLALFHNFRWMFQYAWIGFWLVLAGNGYRQLHKIKKDLRSWGVLD